MALPTHTQGNLYRTDGLVTQKLRIRMSFDVVGMLCQSGATGPLCGQIKVFFELNGV